MDNFYKMRRIHDEAKKTNEQRKKLYAKRQLSNMLSKKFKTTIIGAIAAFEESFGFLWGHGKPLESLSREELKWKTKWDETRTQILNKGNAQLRAALEECNNYDLTWEKYKTELLVVNRTQGDNDEI